MLLRWLLGDDGGDADLDDFEDALYIAIAAGLVVLAGLMSGLTLGLMSLDMVDLEVGPLAAWSVLSGTEMMPCLGKHAHLSPRAC